MEIWKPIPNYEGLYEVSSYGRVRRVDAPVHTAIRHSDTKVWKGRVLKQNLKRNGYYTVDLSKENKVKTLSVHRLVASAFIPREEHQTVVNHKNCNKKDNRAENLEWCTDRENKDHAMANHCYHNPSKVAVKCLQTQQVFDSSYTAAEWVNEHRYQNAKQVKNIASKIRACVLGVQKSAHGYTWAKA